MGSRSQPVPRLLSLLPVTMKLAVFVFLSVAAVTLGRPQTPSGGTAPAVSPAALLGSSKSATPAVSQAAVPAATPAPTYGPKFFGPGLNNPNAVRPYTAHVRQAELVVASNPGVRVFVGVDGGIHFTDQYGQEVEVQTFGFDGKPVNALANVVHDTQDLLRFRFEQKQAKLRLELQEELQEQQQELAERNFALQHSQNLIRGVQQNTAATPNSALVAPINQFRIRVEN